jgi:DNA adenine methylase
MKPFIKWAGGKQSLVSSIPVPNFNRYYEPFLGGGALFLALSPQKATISDANSELITAWKVVQNSVEELIQALRFHKENHSKDYYYSVRASEPETDVGVAARFLYLNKTCFNGLYRVNKKGKFNVPIGSYKNPNICNESVLRQVSSVLAGVDILHSSFEEGTISASKGDFVYLDPPYFPLRKDSFVSYTHTGFGYSDHLLLKYHVDTLNSRGCYVVLSNSYCEEIKELYRNYEQTTVYTHRFINSKASERNKVPELLICNF